ncbi:MAG: hypothetical protein K5978_08715 [Campylobacter sp.]|nr:hypothetical protein [Campylobacter sp.]
MANFNSTTSSNEQNFGSPLTYFKIVALPILIFILLVLGFLKLIPFKVGLQTIIISGFILLIALFFARHNAYLAFAKLEQKSDEFKLCLKNFIMSHLLDIAGTQKSNVKFDEFFDDYVVVLRNDHAANIAAACFALLGILGTFISIALSLPSFSSNNAIGLEKEIASLLSGVGTAFYISIFGIFLSLWWIFFEKIGQAKFDIFYREQKAKSREFFWQKDELEQRFMQMTARHFEDIRTVFARISDEEFFTNLDRVIGNKFDSYKSLQALEQKIISEAQVRVDQNIRLLSKAQSKQEEFLKTNSNILNAINDFNEGLKGVEFKFSTQYNRLNDLMQERMDSLDKNVVKFDNSLKTLDLSLKSFSIKILEEQNRTMDAFKNSMLEGINAFKVIYEQELPSQNDEKRSEMLDELKESAAQLDVEVEEIIKTIETQDEDK